MDTGTSASLRLMTEGGPPCASLLLSARGPCQVARASSSARTKQYRCLRQRTRLLFQKVTVCALLHRVSHFSVWRLVSGKENAPPVRPGGPATLHAAHGRETQPHHVR